MRIATVPLGFQSLDLLTQPLIAGLCNARSIASQDVVPNYLAIPQLSVLAIAVAEDPFHRTSIRPPSLVSSIGLVEIQETLGPEFQVVRLVVVT